MKRVMWMQIVAGAVWLIWLFSGTAGLETALSVGALLVLGLGLRNVLDTFWKDRSSSMQPEAIRPESEDSLRFSGRSYQSAPTGYRPQRSTGHPALRGFERRYDDSGA
jgi:hypothetical protein